MSKAAYWAARQTPARPLDKLVLLAFADCPNDGGLERYPSLAWLCEWTGCDRKTVIKSVDSLEAAGLLVDTGRRIGRTRQIKVYALPVETVPETDPLAQTVPETAPLKSTVFPTKESQKRDTEPPSEPLSSPKATPSSKKRARKPAPEMPDVPDWVPRDAWDRWAEMRDGKAKGLTPGAAVVAIRELRRLADAGHPPGDVLDQSTLNRWAGLFPLKDNRNGSSSRNDHAGGGSFLAHLASRRGSRPDPALDMFREARAELAAESAGEDQGPDSRAWLALPPGAGG